MTRPGTNVVVLDALPPRSAPTTTDAAFFVGITEQGPTGPDLVTSLTDWHNRYGARVNYGSAYDAVEAYFREGGNRCYFSRVLGPAAVAASRTLNDGTAAATLKVSAISPGPYGNSYTVQVATVTGGFTLTIRNGSTVLEVSPTLADKAAALDWGAQSKNVVVSVAGAGGNPATLAASAFSGGLDDHASITDADWLVALNKFGKSLGPGQVAAPGNTSTTTRANIAIHCKANNRRGLVDGLDTNVVASLVSDAAAVRAAAGADAARYVSYWASWLRIGGLTPNTTREVAPSCVVAGLYARSDINGQPIGRPAANQNGRTRSVTAINQVFSSDDLQTLYASQVNIFVNGYNGIAAYGDASLADPVADPLWVGAASNRTVMKVSAAGDAILSNHVFDIIDGQQHLFSKIAGELVAMLSPIWTEGSLYGDTFASAARVDTGTSVNTPTTIAAREVHATIGIRTSPAAEFLELNLVRTATTESLG